MQFKLSLVALSSLAVLVAATPLEPRKNGFICLGALVCCDLRDPNHHETKRFLANSGVDFNSATGLIGTNCTAGDASAEDLDDTCDDNNRIACCPLFSSGSTRTGCSAMDD